MNNGNSNADETYTALIFYNAYPKPTPDGFDTNEEEYEYTTRFSNSQIKNNNYAEIYEPQMGLYLPYSYYAQLNTSQAQY